MLYTDNLDSIIFHRHEIFQSDELIVLSGYIGPKPIERLKNLPFNTKVIYGMYGSEGIKRSLHDSLLGLQNNINNINIFYSKLPIHAKCYVWKKDGKIVHALVGSANFSTNGLSTPNREVLAETTIDTFSPLNAYLDLILQNSLSCIELDVIKIDDRVLNANEICFLSLLGRGEDVQNNAGLNWGQNINNHTTKNDSYIKIRVQDIKDFPQLFHPKQSSPIKMDEKRGRRHRHNDSIEIIWDDGVCMDGLLFGNVVINGIKYPKQVTSFPHASELGNYIRDRLRIPHGCPIRRHHLNAYGRNNIGVTLLNEGVYKFDFSV
ncbi:MAG: restriction endonuclease PLD domain-containing protein [Bacteroidales bacterium]|jgi:hypothetical protein